MLPDTDTLPLPDEQPDTLVVAVADALPEPEPLIVDDDDPDKLNELPLDAVA